MAEAEARIEIRGDGRQFLKDLQKLISDAEKAVPELSFKVDGAQITKQIDQAAKQASTDVDITADATQVTSSIDSAVDSADGQVTATADAAGVTTGIDAAVDSADGQVTATVDATGVTSGITSAVNAAPAQVTPTMDTSGIEAAISDAASQLSSELSAAADDAAADISGKLNAAIGIAAGIAVGGSLKASVDDAAALERGLTEAANVFKGGQFDASDLENLGDIASTLQKEFGVLSDDSLPAIYNAISAGQATGGIQELEDFMTSTAKVGAVNLADMETATDAMSTALNIFAKDGLDANQAAQIFTATVNAGKTDLGQLGPVLADFGGAAALSGVGLDEASAAMAALTAQGVPTAQASTQLRNAINELGDASKGVGATFEDVSGKSFRQFIADGGEMQEAFNMLAEEAEKSGVTIDQMFSTTEAGSGAAMLTTTKGAEVVAGAMEAMRSDVELTELSFENLAETSDFQMAQFSGSMESARQSMGEALLPAANQIMKRLIPAFEQLAESGGPVLGKLADSAGELLGAVLPLIPPFLELSSQLASMLLPVVTTLAGWLGTLVGWLENLGPTLPIIAGGILAVVAAMKAWNVIIGIVRAAQILLNIAMMANPIGLIIGLIVGLIAVFILLWNNVEGFAEFFEDIWDSIKIWVGNAVDWVVQKFHQFILGVQLIWDRTKENVQNIIDFFGDLPGAIVDKVKDIGKTIWNGMKNSLNSIIDGISNLLNDIIQFFRDLPGRALDALGDLGGQIWSAINPFDSASFSITATPAENGTTQGNGNSGTTNNFNVTMSTAATDPALVASELSHRLSTFARGSM